MIYRRIFEITGEPFVIDNLEGYLIDSVGKVLSIPAFGFGPGCVVLCGVDVLSRSIWRIAGELRFSVEDIFGNAAIKVVGRKDAHGFCGVPILETVRGSTRFNGFDLVEFDTQK